ncbi:MAG: BatD family protein [Limisphaerales bacterium]
MTVTGKRRVYCIMTIMAALLIAPPLPAQVSPHVSPEQAARFQVPQPAPDVSAIAATAAFDPPLARVGQSVFYRVTLDGVDGAVQWPAAISGPPQLKFGSMSQGQLMQVLPNRFRPLTSFLYPVQAAAPGHFTIPSFTVTVDGKTVRVPAATLVVDNSASAPPARRLVLEVSATNVYIGQPLRARVMLPALLGNQIEALREVHFKGGGFMSDLTTMRQAVEMVALDGRRVPAFIYEITLTPIGAGPLSLSANAFAAGRQFSGPIMISGHVTISGGLPHYVFLASNPVQLNVLPLPVSGQPSDFNGSIGTFTVGPPRLSTNRIQVGQPVRLAVAVHADGALNRLAPPSPPSVNDWEIIPDNPPGFSFTLIPLTDQARRTPAIPFSYFDPAKQDYVDATIASLPVTVTSAGLPTQMPAVDTALGSGPAPRLGVLSLSPGASVAELGPPQFNGALVFVQIIPLLGILGLWQWDRHRRFLEAHSDLVRRRRARRLLRRERRRLRDAARRGDTTAIVRHAANAMKIACAPLEAAHPQALVCADVLGQLPEADRTGAVGNTVREIFAASETRFSSQPQTRASVSAIESEINAVLLKLEAQL